MITAPYMGLAVWNSVTDSWNHEQLADNFRKLDEHDHASGKGVQIPTGGIKDGAITRAKLAPDTLAIEDGSIDTRHLKDLSVTNAKLAFNAVTGSKIADRSVGSQELADSAVIGRTLSLPIRRATALHTYGRDFTRFTPNGRTQTNQLAQAPRANGESDSIKINATPNGSIVSIYAEGQMTINPAAGKRDSDYVDIRAYAELTYGSVSIAIPLFLGKADKLTKKVTASWASSPVDWGPNQSGTFRRWDADQYSLITNTYGSLAAQTNGGGIVTKYIPTPVSSELAVQVKLRLKVGRKWNNSKSGIRPDTAPPSVDFGVQTLAAWAQSVSPTDFMNGEVA